MEKLATSRQDRDGLGPGNPGKTLLSGLVFFVRILSTNGSDLHNFIIAAARDLRKISGNTKWTRTSYIIRALQGFTEGGSLVYDIPSLDLEPKYEEFHIPEFRFEVSEDPDFQMGGVPQSLFNPSYSTETQHSMRFRVARGLAIAFLGGSLADLDMTLERFQNFLETFQDPMAGVNLTLAADLHHLSFVELVRFSIEECGSRSMWCLFPWHTQLDRLDLSAGIPVVCGMGWSGTRVAETQCIQVLVGLMARRTVEYTWPHDPETRFPIFHLFLPLLWSLDSTLFDRDNNPFDPTSFCLGTILGWSQDEALKIWETTQKVIAILGSMDWFLNFQARLQLQLPKCTDGSEVPREWLTFSLLWIQAGFTVIAGQDPFVDSPTGMNSTFFADLKKINALDQAPQFGLAFGMAIRTTMVLETVNKLKMVWGPFFENFITRPLCPGPNHLYLVLLEWHENLTTIMQGTM